MSSVKSFDLAIFSSIKDYLDILMSLQFKNTTFAFLLLLTFSIKIIFEKGNFQSKIQNEHGLI